MKISVPMQELCDLAFSQLCNEGDVTTLTYKQLFEAGFEMALKLTKE